MMNFMSIWFASFLFSGLFIRIPEVIWPFRLFCYILPLGFTSQAFMWGLMKDVPEYDGAELCTEPLRAERDPLTGQPSHPCGITQDIEFWCPDEAPISCFGRTGPQILDSVGVNYSAFSSDDLYARNTGIVIAIGAVFRLLYLAWMVAKCRTSEEPKPLTPEHIAAAKPDKAPPASDDVALDPAALTPAALPPAGKWEFSFRQCSYVLNVSKSGKKSMLPFKNTVAKPLIFDVTASVSSGELLAILGPSGAGKTVLLNMLTLEAGAGTPFGHITLNGQQLTWPMYRKYCAYVPREDTLWATLTARQHLEHAFSLYRPELPAGPKRAAAVDELLDATGLTSAQHTRAGNALFKGLSGGQKRRLALAIVLVKEPKVLILDEPTSGLDSAAAAAIMRFLRELAVSKSLCVIATIHQPSAAVYSHFSKTLILAKGRTAYYGPADRMTHYFDRIGHTAQESANPAEFVLDLVCPPADHQLVVDKVLDLWADAPAHTVSPISSVEPPRDKVRTAGFGTQLRVLLKRNLMLLVRDPMLYSARIVVLALIVSFFGVIYVEQRNQIQANVMTRFFFIFWGTVVPAMFGAISVYAGNIEYLSVKGEIRNGMNSPVAYLLSNLMVQLPMMLVMAFFVCVPFWAIGNFPWEGFVHAFLLYAANMWVWESMGQVGGPPARRAGTWLVVHPPSSPARLHTPRSPSSTIPPPHPFSSSRSAPTRSWACSTTPTSGSPPPSSAVSSSAASTSSGRSARCTTSSRSSTSSAASPGPSSRTPRTRAPRNARQIATAAAATSTAPTTPRAACSAGAGPVSRCCAAARSCTRWSRRPTSTSSTWPCCCARPSCTSCSSSCCSTPRAWPTSAPSRSRCSAALPSSTRAPSRRAGGQHGAGARSARPILLRCISR
jgi:ABC-type multidrug transport system ATPase subunit